MFVLFQICTNRYIKFSLLESILRTAKENNIAYLPIMDNYPQFRDVPKTSLDANLTLSAVAQIEEGWIFENMHTLN